MSLYIRLYFIQRYYSKTIPSAQKIGKFSQRTINFAANITTKFHDFLVAKKKNRRFYSRAKDSYREEDSPTKMGDRTTGTEERRRPKTGMLRDPPPPPGYTCARRHGRPVQKRHDRDIPWTCRELNISVMS